MGSTSPHMPEKGSVLVHAMGILLLAACLLCSCTNMVKTHFRDTVDEPNGSVNLPGLGEQVLVMRDSYGTPYVEARTMEDMAFAIGYVHASDRLSQMIGFKLVSQGRLAEMAGPAALDLDIYLRTIGLPGIAQKILGKLSPQNMALLQKYSDGVNAYVRMHEDRLPPGIALSGHVPEKWEPRDSVSVFCLVTLALSFNLYEECSTLNVAQAIGAEKTAWLMPIYPDEPLPFEEAAKLKGIDLSKVAASLDRIEPARQLAAALGLKGIAASNNWAISGRKTAGSASILANDTHLFIGMPSMWSMMHVKCGSYDAAGVCVAGVPAVVAGYNGRIAWGMTMVMADNQDLFLEKLKAEGGRHYYLHRGEWLPTKDRQETIGVKGSPSVTVTIRETCHGPLLNDAIRQDPKEPFQPLPVQTPYGIALSWAAVSEDEDSLNTFFSISQASSVDEVFPSMKRIRGIALNMVFADRDNIGWQVTGNYPVRTKGRGFFPSPGWTGEYDWRGLVDPSTLPSSKNPPEGFIGTANNRTVPKDYPNFLSSSWYWPERAERIAQMASATEAHTLQTCMAMHLDTHSTFVAKLKDVLLEGGLAEDISRQIEALGDDGKKAKARLALDTIKGFDGDMAASSKGAAVVSALLDCATKDIFLDELGPENSRAWKSFIVINNESYNATCDHLIVRGDESPFFDDIKTPVKETKAAILARSLVHAVESLEKGLGRDPEKWAWGALHTYAWEVEAYKMAPFMGFVERTALDLLRDYFNRGPYPAPGDYFTLNVSGYTMGRNYDTWLIPAMRLIVDFSREEPMFLVNSSGQSDNPSSPHYDDGVQAWLKGAYIPFPFGKEEVRKHYRDVLVLKP